MLGLSVVRFALLIVCIFYTFQCGSLAAGPESVTGSKTRQLRALGIRNSVSVSAGMSGGHGWIVHREGSLVLIVTAAHVLAHRGGLLRAPLFVINKDDSVFLAHHVTVNADRLGFGDDIGVIAVLDPAGLLGAALDTAPPRGPGQFVMCIGSPNGNRFGNSVGHIVDWDIKTGGVEVDCVGGPGSSGGPVLNSSGEVIGMTTLLRKGNGHMIAIGVAEYLKQSKWKAKTIAADVGWQRVPVPASDNAALIAWGLWSPSSSYPRVGPGGLNAHVHNAYNPEFGYGALLCRFGNEAPFTFHSFKPVRHVQPNGIMTCRINDGDLSGNEGSMYVLYWTGPMMSPCQSRQCPAPE